MDTQNNVPHFDQSKTLRRSGFRTKVSALPDESREYVEDLLKEDRTDVFIANEVNRRYNLKTSSPLGEVSHKAIAAYRKVWRKHQLTSAESLRSLTNFDSNFVTDFKQQIEKTKVISRMCEMFQQQYEAVELYAKREKQLPLPLQIAETARKNCFNMGVQLVDMLVDTGLISKAVVDNQQNRNVPELHDSELLAAMKRVLKQIKGAQEDLDRAKNKNIDIN